jgi:hypothetical protein
LKKLLTTAVHGLENYDEMLRHLASKDAIKVYIQVAPDDADDEGVTEAAVGAPATRQEEAG